MQQLKSGALLQGGKYRIEKVLGQGGFGITYLATQKISIEGPIGQIETEIKLAIKEFFMKDVCNREEDSQTMNIPSVGSREMAERFKQKFIKEAWNISKLKHPHIIKVVDVFEENGTAYYVMEHHDHGSLNSLIKKHGAFSESEALPYILQIANALSYIHEHQMNHLDIKPDNILLNSRGEAVLIDFGLSKCYDADGEQTSSTPVGVSVGYAPLEQSRVGGVGTFSPATDVYSLGATFYKMVTGLTPPEASEVLDEGLPDWPEAISKEVQNAIKRAMEPRRKKRPQSIDEFLMLLKDVRSITPQQNEAKDTSSALVKTVVAESPIAQPDDNKEETVIINHQEKEIKDALSFLRSKGIKDSSPTTAIDLGLSVKWASCNIGASNIIDKGCLVGWGDSSGEYTFETDYLNKKYVPNNIAGTEFDIVTRKMGKGWQMPTMEQWKELIDKCKWEWVEFPFCQGYIVTGTTGEKIFIPVAGRRYGMDAASFSYGYYYVANRSKNNTNYVHYCFFSEYEKPSFYESEYYIGRSIRGIKVKD